MELEKFIKGTLIDVRNGIHEANKEISVSQGKDLGKNDSALFVMRPSTAISFDIAVTVSSNKKGEVSGGGKINISVVDVGGQKSNEKKHSEEYISRIKFNVVPNIHFG